MSNLKITDPKKQRALTIIERSTDLLDNRFRLPFTQIRFGIDFLIGLVPVVGDIVSFGLSGILVLLMTRFGASGSVVIKMLGNVLLDALVGLIPFIGDLFDLTYKANLRNLRLLKEHYEEGKHSGNGCGILIIVFVVLIMLLAGLIYAAYSLLLLLSDLIVSILQ